jgi:hypothetical protein
MSGIERPDTKPLRAHYSTNTKIPKSRILLIKAEHTKKTGKLVKKARKDDSVKKSRADIDTTNFYHPCIDAARNRVGQFPQWKIEMANLVALLLPYVEAINERFIRACFLDPAAGCRPYVVSDAYEAAKHLVHSMAHLPISFIYDIVEHLAEGADTGFISQQYLDGIANAALHQATTTSSLLSGTIASNAPETLTPSQRQVHAIIQKYDKTMRMNSEPIPVVPHWANVEWLGGRGWFGRCT